MTYYEINVAKSNPIRKNTIGGEVKNNIPSVPLYVHLFSTSAHSIRNRAELKKVYVEIKKAFPSPEYQIRVLKINAKSEIIKKTELDAEIIQEHIQC